MAAQTVLIVEDELAIRDMLRMALELAQFDCLEAQNIHEAHTIIVDQRPDIVLLDWMLPSGSGLELMRRLKKDEITRELPVIMLTAKTAEDNIVQGLEAGADDYVTKPFAPKELIARIRSLLRRSGVGSSEGKFQVGQLILDDVTRRIYLAEEPLSVGPTEFNLLKFFMSHPERAYTRGQILDNVWGANVYIDERSVDVHIRRLRKALQTTHADYSRLVQTVRGTGYRFSASGLNS